MSISYSKQGDIGFIVHDDGKANAFTADKFKQFNTALDEAESEGGITIFTGRVGNFSAGYHLGELMGGPESALQILRDGAKACIRMLGFPFPIIGACNGHAFPMGAFLLMCCDYRVGVEGAYKLGMNEVRIGIAPPQYAVEVARGRLAPAYLNRTITTGELFTPGEAVLAGILDEIVSTDQLMARAIEKAEEFTAIDLNAHAQVKLKLRSQWIQSIQTAMDEELTSAKVNAMFAGL